MQLIPHLLFGISASLDALMAGVAFGIRGAQIRFRENLIISMITLFGTCLCVGLGSRLTILLPASLWKLSGSLLLILMGIYYMTKFMLMLLKKYHCKQSADAQPLSGITPAEAWTLGCTLSANNMGIGLSASITGLSMLPTAIVTLLFSFIFLSLGNRLGRCRIIQLSDETATLLTGMLLVCLGLWQLKS